MCGFVGLDLEAYSDRKDNGSWMRNVPYIKVPYISTLYKEMPYIELPLENLLYREPPYIGILLYRGSSIESEPVWTPKA